METFNQVLGHAVNQATLFSSAGPVRAGIASLRGTIKCIVGAATLAATLAAAPTWSAQLPDAAVGLSTEHSADPEEAARAEWRAVMKQMPPTGDGCFHAAYPSIVVERVQCAKGEPSAHPVHLHRTTDEAAVVGNGNDYVVSVTGLITDAKVGFSVTGVTAEKSVGVKSFGDWGILGPNEYSVQLNTNDNSTTSACAGHGNCTVYQQFIYATDYIKPGTAAVFIQYWLVDWGSSACPGGWMKDSRDCFRNSLLEPVPDLSIADLNMDTLLTASVTAGGTDEIQLHQPSEYWWVREPDNVLDISSVWNEAEFNIVGDVGGSEAVFNSGSSITTHMFLVYGYASVPTCLPNMGITTETNNLSLGRCSAYYVLDPGAEGGEISFTESN